MAGGEALVDHRAQHEQAVVAGVGVARPVDVGYESRGATRTGALTECPSAKMISRMSAGIRAKTWDKVTGFV